MAGLSCILTHAGIARLGLLLEQSLGKHREVDAPVAPEVAAVVLVVFVGVAVVVEILAQLLVHLHEEVFLADGNPVEFRLRGEEATELSVEFVGIFVHAGCGRLQAVVVEHLGIEARDAERVAATHRQPRHGTSRALADGAVVIVDEVDDIHETLLHRGLGAALVEGVAVGGVHTLMPPARRSVARRVAVGHDNNHRHGPALGDEVVHDLRGAAKVAPGGLVTAVAVQQIHHGEAALAVVGSRQINGHAALLAQRAAVVPNARQRAMGHVVHLIEMALIGLAFRDDEDVAQRRDVAVDVAVGGVDDALAVNGEAVGIEFGVEGLRRDGPDAVFLPCHRQRLPMDFLEVARHTHLLSCRVEEVEGHRPILVDDGRFHVGTLSQSLLCVAAGKGQAA